MRQVLHVPADPRGQRAILVVLVHGRKVAPLRVAAGELHHARFEINPKPLPLQQEPAHARGRIVRAPSRPQPARSEEQRQESRFQQHAVRLIAREHAARADKRKETRKADEKAQAGPHVQESNHGGNEADPRHRHHRRGARRDPVNRWRVPVALQAQLLRDIGQIIPRGQNSIGTDQALDLKQQRIERGEVDKRERAQKDPPRNHLPPRAAATVEEPPEDVNQPAPSHVSNRIPAGLRSFIKESARGSLRMRLTGMSPWSIKAWL